MSRNTRKPEADGGLALATVTDLIPQGVTGERDLILGLSSSGRGSSRLGFYWKGRGRTAPAAAAPPHRKDVTCMRQRCEAGQGRCAEQCYHPYKSSFALGAAAGG